MSRVRRMATPSFRRPPAWRFAMARRWPGGAQRRLYDAGRERDDRAAGSTPVIAVGCQPSHPVRKFEASY